MFSLRSLRNNQQFNISFRFTKRIVIGMTVLFFCLSLSKVKAQSDRIEICTELLPASYNATGIPNLYWKQPVIKIQFLNGSDHLKNKFRQYAAGLITYANIKFAYIENGQSDVRVAFNPGGSWSYIGISAKDVDKNQPTMNFGWFDEKTSDKELRRVIEHEVGHLLGLVHEHQSPKATIAWNKTAVYHYYKINFQWSRKMVNENIFIKYGIKQTQFNKYDPLSIMQYPIPSEFLLAGSPVDYNNELSEYDKSFIKKIYP